MKTKAKAKAKKGGVEKKKGPKSTRLSSAKSDPFGKPFERFTTISSNNHFQPQLDRPSQLTFEAFPLRHSFRRAGPDHLLSPPATTPHTQRTFAFALAVSTHHLLTLVIDSCIAIHPPLANNHTSAG
ncbi:hypothetical protein L1887_50274 [Cichorium endivia]|nr:hypothetical protein L1887_50274 [Cichorium endivia]